jgi:hypothetical protein
MKIIVFLSLFLLFSSKLFSSQDSNRSNTKSNYELLNQYSKAKLITNDYKKIIVNDVALFYDRVVYRDFQSNSQKTILLNEILLINASNSTYWFEGALLGGLGGVIIPISLSVKNYKVAGSTYMYATLIGAFLGCLIGSTIDNYKTVYHTGDFFFSFQNNLEKFNQNKLYNNLTIIKFQILIN